MSECHIIVVVSQLQSIGVDKVVPSAQCGRILYIYSIPPYSYSHSSNLQQKITAHLPLSGAARNC